MDTAGLQGLISDSQAHAYYNNGYLYMYLYMCGKIHCSFCAMIKNFSDILLGGSENQYHWSPYYKKATPFAYVLHHVKDTCIYLLWGIYIWMNLKIPWRYCHKFFTLKMDQKLQVFWEKKHLVSGDLFEKEDTSMTILLNCSSSCNPACKIAWYKEKRPLLRDNPVIDIRRDRRMSRISLWS